VIVASILARDLKMELFEQLTILELQDELTTWLTGRTEERIVGIDFDAIAGSYQAFVLYTE
jgi:hypothetical protein